MFKVRLFTDQQPFLVKAQIRNNTNLFLYTPPFDIEPLRQPPSDLANRKFEEFKFSCHEPCGDLSSLIVAYYRRVAPTYRAIWTALGGIPPEKDEDVWNQFQTHIDSKSDKEKLSINHCDLSKVGLGFLKGFDNLKELSLQDCQLGDEDLSMLSEILPSLNTLDLSGNSDIRSIPYHSNVKTIDLSQTRVVAISASYYKESHCLKTLKLTRTPLLNAINNDLVLIEDDSFSLLQDFLRKNNIFFN